MASRDQRVLEQLQYARDIIDVGENRALACDGSVGHCREKLTNNEFDEMWQFVENARRILREPRIPGRDKLRVQMARDRKISDAKRKRTT